MLEEEDMVMLLPMVSGMVSSRPMSEAVIACGAEHENSPFFFVVMGYHFTVWHAWALEIFDVFSFMMYSVRFLL